MIHDKVAISKGIALSPALYLSLAQEEEKGNFSVRRFPSLNSSPMFIFKNLSLSISLLFVMLAVRETVAVPRSAGPECTTTCSMCSPTDHPHFLKSSHRTTTRMLPHLPWCICVCIQPNSRMILGLIILLILKLSP